MLMLMMLLLLLLLLLLLVVVVVVNGERKRYLEKRPWPVLRYSTVLDFACFIMWQFLGLNLGL
jgi:hypothetical protein